MDADTAALGDITDDGVARQRLAAAGHLRQQVADALDLHVAALARLVRRRAPRNQLQLVVTALRLDQLLRHVDQVRQAQVTRAKRREHVLGVLQVGLFSQLVEVHRRQIQTSQFALQQRLAGGDVLVTSLQFEPVDDLRPRA